jgi:hypothetical protein
MFDNSRGEIVAAADMPLMQWTGFFDINAIPIYEGDIILSTDEEGRVYWYDKHDRAHNCSDCGIGPVEWLAHAGLWYVAGDIQNSLGDIIDVNDVEVIGHIYQEGWGR